MAPSISRRKLVTAGATILGVPLGYSLLKSRKKWAKEPLAGNVDPAYPQLIEDELYISYNGALLSLQAKSGDVRWQWPKQSSKEIHVKYPPKITDDRVYIGTEGAVVAYEPNRDEVKWRFERGDLWETRIQVTEDLVIAGAGSAVVYAIHREHGSEQWKCNINGSVTGRPVVDSNFSYIPCLGNVYTISHSGNIAWKMDVHGPSKLATSGDNLIVTDEFGVKKLDKNDGTQVWENQTSIFGRPVVNENFVYTGGQEGAAHAFDLNTGKSAWSFNNGGRRLGNNPSQFGVPATNGDAVYYTHMSNNKSGVYALDPLIGEKKWHYSMDNPGHRLDTSDSRLYTTNGKKVISLSLSPEISI